MGVRILGIVGSPRRGNTEILVKEALKSAAEVEGVETDILHVAPLKINPCIACFRCFDEKGRHTTTTWRRSTQGSPPATG